MISPEKLQQLQREFKNYNNRIKYAARQSLAEISQHDIDYINSLFDRKSILQKLQTDEEADKVISALKSQNKTEITKKFDKLAEIKESGTSENEIDYIKRIFSDTHEDYYRYITGELEPPQSDSKGFTEWVDKYAEEARDNIKNDSRDSDIREKELEDIDEYVARLKTQYTHNYAPKEKKQK